MDLNGTVEVMAVFTCIDLSLLDDGSVGIHLEFVCGLFLEENEAFLILGNHQPGW